MAIVYLDPQYQEFADELRRELQNKDVQLSGYAEGLLGLSVEAWLKEAQIETDIRRRDPSPQGLARKIIQGSVEERHVSLARKEKRPVYFHELMAALVESGRRVLDKGF